MPGDTVIVVDDDAAVRDSLHVLLDVAGYATESYASAAAFLKACAGSNNACVLLDLRMPHINGLETLKRLQTARWNPPVIMITGSGDMEMAAQAMQLGAVGFLRKPFQEDELLESVQHALSFAGNPDYRIAVTRAARRKRERLTQRECAVMEMLVTGKSIGEISEALDYSPGTVNIYRARIMQKMEVASPAQLVRAAFLAGVPITEE